MITSPSRASSFLLLSLHVHVCLHCVSSTETARSEGSQTTAAWICLRWNGRIRTTRWDASKSASSVATAPLWMSYKTVSVFEFLAEKRHGQQEDGDLLHGSEEECGQRGKASQIGNRTQNASTFFSWSQKVHQRKYSAERIHPAKGLLLLARWCTGLTWGFCFWFGLLCMHWCVSLSVWASYLHRAHVAEYGGNGSPMILFYYLPVGEREEEGERDIQVHENVFVHLHIQSLVKSRIHLLDYAYSQPLSSCAAETHTHLQRNASGRWNQKRLPPVPLDGARVQGITSDHLTHTAQWAPWHLMESINLFYFRNVFWFCITITTTQTLKGLLSGKNTGSSEQSLEWLETIFTIFQELFRKKYIFLYFQSRGSSFERPREVFLQRECHSGRR